MTLLWLMVAGILAVVLLIAALLAPYVIKKRAQGVPSRTEPLIGQTAFVAEAIDPVHGRGRVTVDGQDWAARSAEPIAAGTNVTVIDADGIVLIVEPKS